MGPPDLGAWQAWATFIAGVALIAATFWSKSVQKWVEIRRRSALTKSEDRMIEEDARIADMQTDLKYLRERVDELLRNEDQQWRLARAHAPWDHQMIQRLLRLDPRVDLRARAPPAPGPRHPRRRRPAPRRPGPASPAVIAAA